MSVYRLSGENALAGLIEKMRTPGRDMRMSEVVKEGAEDVRRGRHTVPTVVRGLCREYGIPNPVAEYRFHPKRRWRADYCWVKERVLLEIDGGVWVKGRHVNPQGFLDDCEKLNSATLLGYRVLRYPPEKLSDAIAAVRLLLLAGGA